MLNVAEITNTLWEGDCLTILKTFPASCVDMILCDLPYGTTQNKWDSVIDMEALWSAYRHILKPAGTVVLTACGLFAAKLMLSNQQWYRYKWVWEKSKATNFLNVRKQPLRKHEDILIFSPKPTRYYPQMSLGKPYDRGVRKDQVTGCYGDYKPNHLKNTTGERYPVDVQYFKTAESEGEVWHPTQKPVALARYMIRTYTQSGDLVLDNAFGSGSFLVGAIEENRKFCGIELNRQGYRFKDSRKPVDYMELASRRLGGLATVHLAGRPDELQ